MSVVQSEKNVRIVLCILSVMVDVAIIFIEISLKIQNLRFAYRTKIKRI